MTVLTHFLLWSIGLASATTQTTDAERACLARHATGRRRLDEVGVWHGVTTCLLKRTMALDDAGSAQYTREVSALNCGGNRSVLGLGVISD